MKFHILIYGCQMNYADSARVKAVLLNCGFEYVDKIEESDIVIFDTCSVRQKSEDKVTGLLKDIPKDKKIWITGCMIQHQLKLDKLGVKSPHNKRGNFLGAVENIPLAIDQGFLQKKVNIGNKNQNLISNLEYNLGFKSGLIHGIPLNEAFNPLYFKLKNSFPNLELFFRIDDVGFLPIILPELGYQINSGIEVYNEYEKIIPEGLNTSMNKHNKTVYVPISTGCNQFCSYCIVPYARGLEKNFGVDHIVNECKIHLQNGAKEVVLLGQIVNKHPQFIEILQKVLKLKGLKWLRYMSPYPIFYSNELLALHELEEKLCPHIHIPFQSGSDKILKSMFRGYTAHQCYEFIDSIRKLRRNISITTDLIVGFCNETEEDFQASLDLARYVKFDMIYIGIYSPRPGTHAARNLNDNITAKIKHQRRDALNTILNQTSLINNQLEVGKTRIVIINDSIGQSKDGFYKYSGYTDYMKQIIIKSKKKLALGDFVDVEVTKGVAFRLYGTVV